MHLAILKPEALKKNVHRNILHLIHQIQMDVEEKYLINKF